MRLPWHWISIVVTSALLAACGSGGSDPEAAAPAAPAAIVDAQPEQPADDAAATPADPMAGTNVLTLSGKVTDNPIANAVVVVTVNGNVYEAPLASGTDGSYEITIASEDPDALVRLEATGPDGVARFSALTADFASLQSDAVDGMVHAVDITNVTTAQVVLAERHAADGSIDSLAELEAVAAGIDTNALLELSAAIKLVIENIDGVTLPAEFADTHELAEAIAAGNSSFLDDVELSTPGALSKSVDKVLTDGNATMKFSPARVPGVYLSADASSLLALFSDGSGVDADLLGGGVDEHDAWSVDAGGRLVLDGEAAKLVTMIGHSGNVVNLHKAGRGSDGEPVANGKADTVVRFKFAGGFDPFALPGTYQRSTHPDRQRVFLPGGGGYEVDTATGMQVESFTWELEEDRSVTLHSNARGVSTKMISLSGGTDASLNVVTIENDAQGFAAEVEIETISRLGSAPVPAGEDAAAMASLAGRSYGSSSADETVLLWFGNNGELSEVAQRHDDGAWTLSETTGSWLIDTGGQLVTATDGDMAPDAADIVSELGDARLSLRDATSGAAEELLRIESFDFETMIGSWTMIEDSAGGQFTLELLPSLTGYFSDSLSGEDFSWSMDAAGNLILSLAPGSMDTRTETYHLMSGADPSVLRIIRVARNNGQLDGGSDPDAPRAVTALTLYRN